MASTGGRTRAIAFGFQRLCRFAPAELLFIEQLSLLDESVPTAYYLLSWFDLVVALRTQQWPSSLRRIQKKRCVSLDVTQLLGTLTLPRDDVEFEGTLVDR